MPAILTTDEDYVAGVIVTAFFEECVAQAEHSRSPCHKKHDRSKSSQPDQIQIANTETVFGRSFCLWRRRGRRATASAGARQDMRDRAARHRPCGGVLDEGHCICQIQKAPQGRARPVMMPRPDMTPTEAALYPVPCFVLRSFTEFGHTLFIIKKAPLQKYISGIAQKTGSFQSFCSLGSRR